MQPVKLHTVVQPRQTIRSMQRNPELCRLLARDRSRAAHFSAGAENTISASH